MEIIRISAKNSLELMKVKGKPEGKEEATVCKKIEPFEELKGLWGVHNLIPFLQKGVALFLRS